MAGRTRHLLPPREPWWARYVLTLIKIVLAFALAVLTLIFAHPARRGTAPAAPTPPGLEMPSDNSDGPDEPDEPPDHNKSAP